MKKKFITLFLAVVFILCNATVAFAEEQYNFVTGTQAVEAVDKTDVVIVDVRTPQNYDMGHLKNSISIPLFDANGVSNGEDDALAKAFTEYLTTNAATFTDKNIYIVCNSGAKGAQAATKLLLAAGYAPEKVFTIEGGAKGTDTDKSVPENLIIDYKFVSGKDAVAAIGNTEVVIVDVRTTENYNKGHLKGAISIPLFDANGVTTGSDALATAFTDYLTANAATFTGKDIYIVCNSGARGAQAATKLLLAGGYSLNDIFTITGGAKGTDEDKSVPSALTYVSAAQAISVIDNAEYVIIDVRTAENYAKGHLKGSVSVPLFNANGVTNGSDELAKAFTDYVNANKESLSAKTIYILCNSGARGAQNATTLLLAAGIPADKVFTIEGGATNTSIQEKYITDAPAPAPSTTPKTGDAASSMMYVMLMVVALGAVVVINKKRVVK